MGCQLYNLNLSDRLLKNLLSSITDLGISWACSRVQGHVEHLVTILMCESASRMLFRVWTPETFLDWIRSDFLLSGIGSLALAMNLKHTWFISLIWLISKNACKLHIPSTAMMTYLNIHLFESKKIPGSGLRQGDRSGHCSEKC